MSARHWFGLWLRTDTRYIASWVPVKLVPWALRKRRVSAWFERTPWAQRACDAVLSWAERETDRVFPSGRQVAP